MNASDERAPGLRRLFRRGPWENAAMLLIGLGVLMLISRSRWRSTATPFQ
jgi:hypothetical protein